MYFSKNFESYSMRISSLVTLLTTGTGITSLYGRVTSIFTTESAIKVGLS